MALLQNFNNYTYVYHSCNFGQKLSSFALADALGKFKDEDGGMNRW
jgi:hypothetical protein